MDLGSGETDTSLLDLKISDLVADAAPSSTAAKEPPAQTAKAEAAK